MKLHLKNFCCWEDREFNFTDKGTVLISAPSGEGKTSIIRAIMFALFGTGQKVITHGKRSCSVKLSFQDLTIYRSKGPCRLIVNDVYEDAAAQHIIHKYFQDSSFHVAQGGMNSFVMMGAIDKLKFLEKIIFNSIDIIDIKTRVKHTIKQREDMLLTKKTEAITIDAVLEELEIPDEVVLPDSITFSEKSIGEYEEKLKNFKILYNNIKLNFSKRDEYQQKILDIQSTIKHTSEVLDALKLEQKTYIDHTETDIEGKLDEKQQVLDWITNNERYDKVKQEYLQQRELYESCITDEKDELESKISDIQKSIDGKSIRECKKNINNINNNIQTFNRYNDLKQEYDDIEYIDITSIEEELSEKQDNLQNLRQTLSNLKSAYKCPGCDSTLHLKDDTLVVVDDIPYNDTEIKSTIRNIKNEIVELKQNLKNYNSINSKKDFLYQKISDIGDVSALDSKVMNTQLSEAETEYAWLITQKKLMREYSENLDTIINKYNKIKERVVALKNKCRKLKASTHPVEENRADIESNIQELRDQLALKSHKQEKYNQIGTKIQSTQRQLNNLYEEEEDLDYQISKIEITENLDDVETRIEECRDTLDLLKNYHNYFSKQTLYIKYEKKCLELETEIKEAEVLLVAAMRFKEKIGEAESIALTNLVNTINTNVQLYLDIFFEKEPLTATIKCFKEVKNSKKSQINIEIQHKGNQVDLQSLSGGERDRVILAFALTIADTSITPMILLDECVSSLDQENANIVFDCIKSQTGKLVILVAHQIVTGMFDQVLTL